MWPQHGHPRPAHLGPGPEGPQLSAGGLQACSGEPWRRWPAAWSPRPYCYLHRGWSRAPGEETDGSVQRKMSDQGREVGGIKSQAIFSLQSRGG